MELNSNRIMTATCQHWSDINHPQGGKCNLHARTCSFGVCRACLDNTAPTTFPPAANALQRARLGTRLKAATTALGIPPCSGCNRRAQILNGDPLATPLQSDRFSALF